MKQNFIICVALLLLAACTTNSNTLIEEGLNGKVKTVKSMCYEAEEQFGEVEKDGILDEWDSDNYLSLYPACHYEYNKDGYIVKTTKFDEDGDMTEVTIYEYDDLANLIKETSYDEDGDVFKIITNKYIKKNLTAQYTYASNGELDYFWEYTIQNGKPIDYKESWISYSEEYELKWSFDGFNIKSFSLYNNGNLTESGEYLYKNHKLSLFTKKDSLGFVTYKYEAEWSKCGQLLFKKQTSEGIDKLIVNNEYDEIGDLIQHTRSGDWSGGDVNYTFKYTSFDEKGNWLERIIYTKNKAHIIQERTIEYY